MLEHDFDVARVDTGFLGRCPEQRFRITREVLIDGRARGHENCHAAAAAATGAPESLPQSGNRSGVARAYDGVERPDVDTELEGARRHDAEHFAVS
jgi:hypothetical protein